LKPETWRKQADVSSRLSKQFTNDLEKKEGLQKLLEKKLHREVRVLVELPHRINCFKHLGASQIWQDAFVIDYRNVQDILGVENISPYTVTRRVVDENPTTG